MAEQRHILVIDDDPGLRALLRATLGDDYAVEQAVDGPSGLAAAARRRPDLILLDIKMPGMAGYEVCRALKGDDATRRVPVVFLSALNRVEDRLAAYEAGGDDFIAKPFDPVELLNKVAAVLRFQAECQRLAAESKEAFQAAMVAMTSASEIGMVLDFVRRSFDCADYAALADAVVAACASYGLAASVQIRGAAGSVARNRAGNSSPLEAGVLTTLAGCGRLVSQGRRTAVSFEHVTVMALDMPLEEADRVGRLRDDLALLAETADARVRAVDDALAVQAQGEALQRLLGRVHGALSDIDGRYQAQKVSAVAIMHGMLDRVESAVLGFGLSEQQEALVAETLRTAVYQVFELFDQGLGVDRHLHTITAELAAAMPPEPGGRGGGSRP